MPEDPLYLEAKPGDLITAEAWNELQRKIQADIDETAERTKGEITEVDHAGDAAKLDGKTLEELSQQIVERALRELSERSGYRRIHTVLHLDEERVIEHKLGLAPLVDLYRLDYFPVVYREDDQTYPSWATFYLRHTSERSIRYTDSAGKSTSIEIQPTEGPAGKLALADLLTRYKVEIDDDLSLDEVETRFWEAFLASPNDGFDDRQYGHSPWFERCCKEKKLVRDLKRQGDWDDLWLQMRPLNWRWLNPELLPVTPGQDVRPDGSSALVQVRQLDFDTLSLTLKSRVRYPREQVEPRAPLPSLSEVAPNFAEELKVMVLLKA